MTSEPSLNSNNVTDIPVRPDIQSQCASDAYSVISIAKGRSAIFRKNRVATDRTICGNLSPTAYASLLFAAELQDSVKSVKRVFTTSTGENQ